MDLLTAKEKGSSDLALCGGGVGSASQAELEGRRCVQRAGTQLPKKPGFPIHGAPGTV